jgi:hypothetical protein
MNSVFNAVGVEDCRVGISLNGACSYTVPLEFPYEIMEGVSWEELPTRWPSLLRSRAY